MVDDLDQSFKPCILVDITKPYLKDDLNLIGDHSSLPTSKSPHLSKNYPFLEDIQCPVCLSTVNEIREESKGQEGIQPRKSAFVMCPFGRSESGNYTHGMCLPCALTLYFDLFHESQSSQLAMKCPSCRKQFNTIQLAKLIKVPTQLSIKSLLKDISMLVLLNIPTQLIVSRWLMKLTRLKNFHYTRLNLDWLYLLGVKRSIVQRYDRLGGFLPFSIAFGYVGYAFGNSLSMTLFSLIAQRIRELLAYQASERRFDWLTNVGEDRDFNPNISSSLFFLIIGLCLFPTILLDKIVRPSIPVFPQFVMDVTCALCLGASHFYITRSLSTYSPTISIASDCHNQELLNASTLSKYPMLYSKIRNTFFIRRGFVLRFLSSTLCMIGRLIALYLLQKRWIRLFSKFRDMKKCTSSFSLGILTAYLQTIIRGIAYMFDVY